MKSITTKWAVRDYDVWGNAKDGYDVNDVRGRGEIELRIPVTVNNAGTPHQFLSAYPTDRQLRDALGIRARVRIDKEGDDVTIHVNAQKDGYPCGELRCLSHKSLSPVRE